MEAQNRPHGWHVQQDTHQPNDDRYNTTFGLRIEPQQVEGLDGPAPDVRQQLVAYPIV